MEAKSFDFTDQFQEQKQPLFVHTIFLREGYLGFLSKSSPNTILRHKFIRSNIAIMMKNIFQVHTTVVINICLSFKLIWFTDGRKKFRGSHRIVSTPYK